jgi:hypothetical protein
MAKHKYLFNFDLFICGPTPFSNLLDYDYTHGPYKGTMICMVHFSLVSSSLVFDVVAKYKFMEKLGVLD